MRSHEFAFGSSLGFDGLIRTETIEAFDQDGSKSQTKTIARWRLWRLPERTIKFTRLILRKENRTLDIDHQGAVFQESRRGASSGMPTWEEDDAACSHTMSHYLYLSDRLPDAVVAGVHVVGYSGQDYKGADYEVFFAPSLGCETMRFQMSMRTFLGLKKAEYERVVDSFELGAPAASLFTVPSGFRRVDSVVLR